VFINKNRTMILEKSRMMDNIQKHDICRRYLVRILAETQINLSVFQPFLSLSIGVVEVIKYFVNKRV
jgi:hypothetical protein